MRWLLLKDLQILRRSPLQVAILIIYPIVIAILIGVALSRGPEKPTVAFFNEVPAGQSSFSLGSERIDASQYSKQFFQAVNPIRVKTRAEAFSKVRSGEALAALIIPADIVDQLAIGSSHPTVEVAFNAEDPIKAQFVEAIIKARLADVNAVLSKKLSAVALDYLRLILTGGKLNIFGQQFDVLGLKQARDDVANAAKKLQPLSQERNQLNQVVQFASLAIKNLDLSDDFISQVADPVKVKKVVLTGKRVPLNSFAIAVAVAFSLMFLAVLLGAGMLALEREENVFNRLVRNLVPKWSLLAEKIGLAGVCSFIVGLVMLSGIGLFVGLRWERFGWWVLAMAASALAFGALGVAIGALAREVRAASLLAFLTSLPIAFLALVPTDSVTDNLYKVILVISAAFPFKPALESLNAALNNASPGIWAPFCHLLGLTIAFTVVARLAMRRFAKK